MFRKILLGAVPVLIIGGAIAAVVVLGATAPKPEQAEETAEVRRYFAEPVRVEPVTLQIETQGEVRPKNQIELTSQVPGRIVWISEDFVEGASVAAGETLVRLDDADYRLTLARAESTLAQAQRLLAEEQASAAINRKQWNWDELKDSDRPSALALREPQLAERRAAVRAAEAEVENARVNLGRTELTAPFDGRILSRDAGLGQYVAPGSALGELFATDVVQVRLPLTDLQLGRLGMPLGYEADYAEARPVTFSAEVAGAQRQWQGRLVRISAAVDPGTRLVYGIAELREPYGAARDGGVPMAVGLFVKAEIDGRSLNQAFVLPRAALRGENQVYVVDADNRLKIHRVDVLDTTPERAIVTAGVSAGDRVITSPVQSVREGIQVEVIDRSRQAQVASLPGSAGAAAN
ncbi:MAG: efflux RND transporter periplasmic adaptor subunit [Rhodothalassiaceae bacterium]